MKETFILKDSPSEVLEATQVAPKGRTYDKEYGLQPGGVRIEDLVLGMKLACVAITDDKNGTLARTGKTDPWHIEALKVITGSEGEAHKPLTYILETYFDLQCDEILNISGFTKAGHALDTQGYIAHNDEIIVLAYRCTTSGKDWLTNLSTSTSEWEPEIDIPQGFAGHFSGLMGLCCQEEYKPRVHTGFYNNFLVSAPYIQQHIDPLLAEDHPPRKLFVVGHSLGAGIATMATCYFLLEHKWEELPQKFINVTAGSPRACRGGMRDIIQERMATLRPLDKAVICRVVRDKDVVSSVPPSMFGFVHLDKLVFITEDGKVLINPELDDSHILTEKEMKDLMLTDETETEPESDEEEEKDLTKYEKRVAVIPRPFRDHMPDFYLKPLIKLIESENPPSEPAEAGGDDPASDEDPQPPEEAGVVVEEDQKKSGSKGKKRFSLFRRNRKKRTAE